MKKQNRFWAAVLALSLCLALALPAVAAGSPRIQDAYSLAGIPKGYEYHAVSGEVILKEGSTITVTGSWILTSGSLWVGIFNDESGTSRSVCLQQSGDTKSFTVPQDGYYVLQVSSPDFKLRDGTLVVTW